MSPADAPTEVGVCTVCGRPRKVCRLDDPLFGPTDARRLNRIQLPQFGVERPHWIDRRRPARMSRAARPLVSEATIAEAAAMEERDRLAGGPPWEVADHPDNDLPGGWHHGQLTGHPAPGWDEERHL